MPGSLSGFFNFRIRRMVFLTRFLCFYYEKENVYESAD